MSKIRILKAPEVISLFMCVIIAVFTIFACYTANKINYEPAFMQGYYAGISSERIENIHSEGQISEEAYENFKISQERLLDEYSEERMERYLNAIYDICGEQLEVNIITRQNEKAFSHGHIIGSNRQKVQSMLFRGEINSIEYSDFCKIESEFLRNPTEKKSKEFINFIFSILYSRKN